MSDDRDEFRILSPTGILGYGFPTESFERGMACRPHLIAVDAGSTDPGPYYLGSGKSFTNRLAVKRDLRRLLGAGVRNKIPVVIGSAGGCGARPHVDWCRAIVEEVAREEGLHFKLGILYADLPHAVVLDALRAGRVRPMSCVPPLTAAVVAESRNLVAQMGVEPILPLLAEGCDVILCGRCYDPAVFAALPIARGYPEGLALHLGKILECAAIAATPGSGADAVLGRLYPDRFVLEALNPIRRFTRESTAAHTLYEKSDPCHLPGPGGVLNLEACEFRELPDGRTVVTGSRHERTEPYCVKLEGARSLGFRTVCVAGVRDPRFIAAADQILADVQAQLARTFVEEGLEGRVYFHVYGRNGVMGEREPLAGATAHELGLVVDAIGSTPAASETICSLTRSTLLHYGYPGRISTAGNLAFPFSPSDLSGGEVFEFSVYHLLETDAVSPFAREIVAC